MGRSDNCAVRCMRPGRITSNGYLNFLREYRKKHCGMKPQEIVSCGAKAWNKLSCAEKRCYAQIGCKKRQSRPRKRSVSYKRKRSGSTRRRKRSGSTRRRKRSCSSRRRKRSCSSRKRKRSCSSRKRRPSRSPRPRKRSTSCRRRKIKKDPLTSNGFLNFVRSYRRKVCGLNPNELLRKAARIWCNLPQNKKDFYNRQACKVTTSRKHKRRRLCREMRKKRRRRC